MKLIVLAAGRGERLMPLTKNTPKPLLDLGNGNTLLEEQFERIEKSGAIGEIVLIVGYLAEQIEAKVRAYAAARIPVRTVFNPFFEVSNNLISLWLARHEMDSDFVITNGDNLFAADVYSGLVDENRDGGIYLSMVTRDEYTEEDMKVQTRDGVVARVSKRIPSAEANGESPGLVLVRGERHRAIFVEMLEQLARDPESLNAFWLEVFNQLHARGVPIQTWEFDWHNRWQEIDFHFDIALAKQLIERKISDVS